MQKILDMVMKGVTIVFFLFFIVGGIVVLRYCNLIGYFPTGLNVGDSLFFISVAISFSIVYIAYLLFISSVCLFLVWFLFCAVELFSFLSRVMCKTKMPHFDHVKSRLLFIATFFVTVFFAWLVSELGFNDFVIAMLASIPVISILIGFLLWSPEDSEPLIYAKFWDCQLPHERKRVTVQGIVMLLIFFYPLVFSEAQFQVSKIAFNEIGVAKKHVDIYVDSKMEHVFNRSDAWNDEHFFVENTDILWTGVGSRSVIEVKIDGEPHRFVVNTDELSFSY